MKNALAILCRVVGKLPQELIRYFRQANVVMVYAMTLSILAFPARGDPIGFTNGSFTTTGGYPGNTTDPTTCTSAANEGTPACGSLMTSSNITGPGTTPIVIPGWNTTTDGIGCVVFPGTELTNVCGLGRFSGSTFFKSPGPVPGGGNYVLVDGAPVAGVDNSNTTTLYQVVTGLTPGQSYNVNFWQAAAEFQFESGTANTTEQWLVSFDTSTSTTAYTNCNPALDQNITGPNGCESQFAPAMNNQYASAVPWAQVSMTFLAQSPMEFLGFFAQGTPGGEPPIDLLGDISVTAVPEPGTCVLLGGALLGFGIARRRRNKCA